MTNRRPIEELPNLPLSGMAWQSKLFWLIVLFGPSVYFATQHDYVVASVFAAAGCTAFTGFRIGAAAIITSVVAIAAAVTYAPSVGFQQEWRFNEWFGTTGLLNRFISIAAVGLAITIGTTFAVALVTGRVFRLSPTLEHANRWLGFAIGGVEGTIATLFLLGGVLVLEPIEQQRSKSVVNRSTRSEPISQWVLATAEHTHRSQIGPFIEQYNPFVRFPQLNKIEQVQKSVQVLSDPQRIERLMRHPEVQHLQDRPEVRTAVRKVMDDPQIRNALNSGVPMNRSIAMMMLNHPAILELVDQPGFMRVVSKAIQSSHFQH